MERARGSHSLAQFAPLGAVLGAFAVTVLGLSLAPGHRESSSAAASPVSGAPQDRLMGRSDVEVQTVAGGAPGLRDGAAWEARFNGPNALALEPQGTLLVCDSRNHRIRRVLPGQRVETVVGGGPSGGPGGEALGSALEARLRYPSGVACDPSGVIYVADTGNHRICRLRNGTLSLLAGGTRGTRDGAGSAAAFDFPSTLSYDPAGALWVADAGSGRVRRVSLTGGVTTPAAVPSHVATALGSAGGEETRTVVRGWRSGSLTTLLDSGWVGRRSGGATVPIQRVYYRRGVALTATSLQLFADTENHVLMAEQAPEPPFILAGSRTVAGGNVGGQDGTGETATFSGPAAVVRSNATLYVADYEGNRIRRVILPDWVFTTGMPDSQNR